MPHILEHEKHIFRLTLLPDPPAVPEELSAWIQDDLIPALITEFEEHQHEFPDAVAGGNMSLAATSTQLQASPVIAGEGALAYNSTDKEFQGSDGTIWLPLSGGAGSPHQLFFDFGTRSVAYTA